MNKDMRILGTGDKLFQAWGGTTSILNKHVTEIFKLRRPKGISFTWGNVSNIHKIHCICTNVLKAAINDFLRYFQTYNIHTYRTYNLQYKT